MSVWIAYPTYHVVSRGLAVAQIGGPIMPEGFITQTGLLLSGEWARP